MKLQAPICKSERSSMYSCGFFSLEASLPALGEGVDRLSTKAFLPWSDLVYPLLTHVPYSSSWFYHRGGWQRCTELDLMACQIDF